MTWPDVPQPWSVVPYHATRYRAGYRTAYAGRPVKIFRDPRTWTARAYFEGFDAGTAAREAGVLHEQTILVPEQYTSGHSRKAYREAYKIARKAVEEHMPVLEQNELYSRNRTIFSDNPSWGSGTAFDAGWRAGALSVGVLSPPLPGEKSQIETHQDPTINGGRS